MKNNFLKKYVSYIFAIFAFFTSMQLFAAQQAANYTSGARYNSGGQLTGTLAPDPDGTGSLHYLATRNTYNSAGLLETVEKGELLSWQSEDVAPSQWEMYTTFTKYSTQVFTYDKYGRKASVTVKGKDLNVLSLTEYSYDAYNKLQCSAVRMNLTPTADENKCNSNNLTGLNPDRITRYEIDSLGQVRKEERALLTEVSQIYARNVYVGRWITQSIDANNNLTEFRYDNLKRLVRIAYPSKTVKGQASDDDYVEFSNFDGNGNARTERKRNGAIINYTYDNNNRVTYKDYVDNATLQDVSIDYDLRGLVLTSRFGSDTGPGVTNAFDGFGNLSASTTNMGGFSRTLSYVYDLNNNRKYITHPDGVFFKYNFDGLNRVNGINEGETTSLLNVNYATDGGRKSIVRTGGATTTYGLVGNTYAMDDGVHLKNFTQDFYGTVYDLTTTFTYNNANQIETLSKNNSSYSYQGNDNRAGVYKVNGLNQYTTIAGQVLDQTYRNYDPNGNLVDDGINTYSYDNENRLLGMISPAGSGSFIYDPNGRLFQATVAGTVTQYLYDGDALVGEYNSSGALIRRYVHGDQVDEPLVQYNGNVTGTPYRRYLHTDHQGSIIAHSDASGLVFYSNGTLAYDSFGIPAAKNNSVPGAFGYTGQVYFPALGINYYKARMYNPKLGRFLQTDPIGYKDDMDLYSYVGNDPLNKNDPTGMTECPATFCYGPMYAPGYDIGKVNPTTIAKNEIENGKEALKETADIAVNAATTVVAPEATLIKVAAGGIRSAGFMEKVAANINRFFKKIPSNAKENVVARPLPNGSTAVQATSPGKVPGSNAVYEKQIDSSGNTVQFTKTTYDPEGNIVHVKDKITGEVFQ